MSRFRVKPWMALAALLLVLVVAFFATFYVVGGNDQFAAVEKPAEGDGHNSAVEGVAGAAVTPAVSGASGFAASIRDFFDRLFALREVDKEYDQLKIRVQQLELENQAMLELQRENDMLHGLLDYKEQYPNYEFMPARVIAKDPGGWFVNFDLNRGSVNGIKVDMNVVNEDGLVGRVIQVGPTWCKVMAIIDRQSAVSAIIEQSRYNCMVKGSGDPQTAAPTCELIHLPVDAETVPGDRVVTSDLGGTFMKGILIGTVSEVSRDQKKLAVLTPAVDFARLETVLIIKGEKVPVATATATAGDATGGEPADQASPSPEAGEGAGN